MIPWICLNIKEMMNAGQFNYIDRQQSQASGNSEKSHKVHCANWKEEVHLRKELKALTRQENSTIKRIFCDQKIVANKFRHRVYRTMKLIKTHEELKVGMASIRSTNNSAYGKFQPKYNAPGLLFTANVDKASSLGLNVKEKFNHLLKRPVTASELRVQAWERKVQTMSSKLQRAQSAPALRPNFHSVEEKYITKLNNSKICKTVDRKSRNSYMSVKYKDVSRDVEVAKQREAVMSFIEKIKELH
jgi:hypothetical protein